MRRREPGLEISLAGHPQKLPGAVWRRMFEKRMDDWLKARGQRVYTMRDMMKTSVAEAESKKKARPE